MKNDSEIVYTTNAGWVRAIYLVLQEAGLDSDALFTSFDIPTIVLAQSDVRVDVSKVRKLWTHVTQTTGNDAISLSVTLYVNNTANIVTVLGSASKNLRDATEKMSKFISAATTALHVTSFSDDYFNVEIGATATGVYVGDEAMDAVMARITHLAAMASSPGIKPLRVLLRRPPPQAILEFERFFNCPIEFSQETNRIVFSLESAIRPLKTTNLSLSTHLEQYLKEYIEKNLPSDTTNQLIKNIYRNLSDMLPMGKPTIVQMAKRLNMSQRTLQRKLKEENVSFQELLNKIRFDLASYYLKKGDYTIEAISDLLGFSSYTSFIRFFKSETNLTPKEFAQKNSTE